MRYQNPSIDNAVGTLQRQGVTDLLLIPLFFLSHPSAGNIVHHLFVPGIPGGANSTAVLLIISIVGTTTIVLYTVTPKQQKK